MSAWAVSPGMCNVVNDWAACSVITTATPHRSSGAQAGRNGYKRTYLFEQSDRITVDPRALERTFTIPERNRAIVRRCCTARSESLTSLCRSESHPAQ